MIKTLNGSEKQFLGINGNSQLYVMYSLPKHAKVYVQHVRFITAENCKRYYRIENELNTILQVYLLIYHILYRHITFNLFEFRFRRAHLLKRTAVICGFHTSCLFLFWHASSKFLRSFQGTFTETQNWNDPRRTVCKGTRGIQHGTVVCTDPIGQEQHTGPHQLQKQQKTTGQSKGFWPVSKTVWLLTISLWKLQGMILFCKMSHL